MEKQYNKENGRKNMRLQGYDYALEGLYFLTIVVQNRWHLFGHIENGQMKPNEAGIMVEKWYDEIENKYPDKHCHEMVIMPNHFHCIIENTHIPIVNDQVELPRPEPNERYGIHNKRYKASIGDVMSWFKTMTTNEYIRGVKEKNWKTFDRKLWQRNYHDHIIRDEQAYHRIAQYIINNPTKWDEDKFSKE